MRKANKKRRHKIEPNARQKATARFMFKGLGPTEALRAAGYPKAQARKGMAFIADSAGIRKALIDLGRVRRQRR